MLFFYNGNLMHAKMSTQNFVYFDWGHGVKIFRLPSTFTFATQFSVFTLCALVPAVTAIVLSETQKEKYFFSMILVIVILGAYSSGIRATTIYLLLFILFLSLINARFYNVLIFSVLLFVIASFTNWDAFPTLKSVIVSITQASTVNIENWIFEEYGKMISSHYFGAGVGSATFEARHVSPVVPIHEGFYHKTIKELGVFGLLVVPAFLLLIIYEIFLSATFLKKYKISIFCSVILSVYLIAIIMGSKGAAIFTKYPSNFLLYFFLGMTIKLRFLDFDNEKNQ